MQEKRHPKDILDAITFYTPRNQAAIFITLEYVNLGLEKVMPYSNFYPYEDDYYRMIEHICSEGSDEQLSRILELMMMDLQCLVAPFEKSITKTGKIRKNSKYSPDLLILYCIMMDALMRIMKKFHTMSESDINQLLKDRTIENGILYFHEIEKLSDCIIVEMMSGMMSTLNIGTSVRNGSSNI